MTSLRMALASTWRSTGSDRLRSVVVAVAAAVLTIVVAAAASIWLSTGRINDRAAARNFAPATEAETVAYQRNTTYDEAPNGGGILVAQWQLADDSDPLPGIPADATGWYVSPRLSELIDTHPELAISYPDAKVIGNDGVARADELVAFDMSPPTATAFNETMTSTPFGFYGDSAELELLPIVLVVIALLGIPGLSLMSSAVGISSPKRERTAQLLHTIGAPPRSIHRYALLTGLLGALPGSVPAAIGWTLVAPSLTTIPFVGRPVFRGDLSLPLHTALAGC